MLRRSRLLFPATIRFASKKATSSSSKKGGDTTTSSDAAGEEKRSSSSASSSSSSHHSPISLASNPGRLAALNAALSQIEKDHGKGVIMKLGAKNANVTVDAISTGSLSLDLALGCGGFPRGRIIEVYGAEMSGKTTLALQVIAEAQKRGGACTFVDAEHALDPTYARALGVNLDELHISQPDSGEQALDITDTLVRSGAMDVVVVDSVAALVPKAELEGDMGDAHMGLQARLMSQAMRKLTASVSRVNTVLIFINQIRSKIGMFAFGGSTTSGGNALKFYASQRLELKAVGKIKRGSDIIGNQVRIKVSKNKLAPPFREVEVDIEFGKGISWAGELIDLGVLYSLVKKNGAHFKFNDIQLGLGKENAKKFLMENQEIAGKLREEVLAAAQVNKDVLLARPTDDDEGEGGVGGAVADDAQEGGGGAEEKETH